MAQMSSSNSSLLVVLLLAVLVLLPQTTSACRIMERWRKYYPNGLPPLAHCPFAITTALPRLPRHPRSRWILESYVSAFQQLTPTPQSTAQPVSTPIAKTPHQPPPKPSPPDLNNPCERFNIALVNFQIGQLNAHDNESYMGAGRDYWLHVATMPPVPEDCLYGAVPSGLRYSRARMRPEPPAAKGIDADEKLTEYIYLYGPPKLSPYGSCANDSSSSCSCLVGGRQLQLCALSPGSYSDGWWKAVYLQIFNDQLQKSIAAYTAAAAADRVQGSSSSSSNNAVNVNALPVQQNTTVAASITSSTGKQLQPASSTSSNFAQASNYSTSSNIGQASNNNNSASPNIGQAASTASSATQVWRQLPARIEYVSAAAEAITAANALLANTSVNSITNTGSAGNVVHTTATPMVPDDTRSSITNASTNNMLAAGSGSSSSSAGQDPPPGAVVNTTMTSVIMPVIIEDTAKAISDSPVSTSTRARKLLYSLWVLPWHRRSSLKDARQLHRKLLLLQAEGEDEDTGGEATADHTSMYSALGRNMI